MEAFFPLRRSLMNRRTRWTLNFGVSFFNYFLLKGMGYLSIFSVADVARMNPWGVFRLLEAPKVVEILLSVCIMDLAIYWQHRIFHRVPYFWRWHRFHHADEEFDISTGVRFHPVEMVFSYLYKLILVFVFGISPMAYLIFEICLSSAALISHSNIRLPSLGERYLRMFLVTSDMHRIHHSRRPSEAHSNFSFFLSLWDRIFSSYCPTAKSKQEIMAIGLPNRDDESRSLASQAINAS